MNPTSKKIIRIAALIIGGAIIGAIGFFCWKISLDRETFKIQMDSLGFWGYIVYVLMVLSGIGLIIYFSIVNKKKR